MACRFDSGYRHHVGACSARLRKPSFVRAGFSSSVLRSSADSDGGIDDRKESGAYYRIPASLLLRDGDKLLGVHSLEHDFLFADPSTHKFEKLLDQGFVGGWGDVEESVTYHLFIGPLPQGVTLPVTEPKWPWFMDKRDWTLF